MGIDCFIATIARRPDDVKPGEDCYPKMDKKIAATLLTALENNGKVKSVIPQKDHEGDLVGVSFDAPDGETFLEIVRGVFGDELDFEVGNDLAYVRPKPRSFFHNWAVNVKKLET